ncbi:hypothetical protein [Siminovitchia fortis]|nr:hypothetical protein [Siminovitchia fortis]
MSEFKNEIDFKIILSHSGPNVYTSWLMRQDKIFWLKVSKEKYEGRLSKKMKDSYKDYRQVFHTSIIRSGRDSYSRKEDCPSCGDPLYIQTQDSFTFTSIIALAS